MRIALLLSQARGGPADVAVSLGTALAATGEVDIRVFAPAGLNRAERLDGRYELVEYGRGDVVAAARVRRALRAWRPDLVHAHDRRSGLVAAGLQAGSRGPAAVVHTYHGVPDGIDELWFRGRPGAPRPPGYVRAVLAAEAVVARAVTRTVVPSPPMRRFLRRRLGVPAARIVHIDNGVPMRPVLPSAGPVRHLVFVGMLIERKGLLDLLIALGRPDTMPADARLTVVGDGPERRAAESLSRVGPLAGRVEFAGYRTATAPYLAAADALVLPSRLEQQPLVVAEAMAIGRPVLATDTGGVADMLDVPGARQFLARPGDVDSLAAALRDLFAEPAPELVGKALAEAARERFDEAVCARRHLRLYRQLTGSAL